MLRYTTQIEKCKHDVGFHCQDIGDTYAFVCNRRCGYYMAFDPGSYPNGVAFVMRQGLKELPPLQSSEVNPQVMK